MDNQEMRDREKKARLETPHQFEEFRNRSGGSGLLAGTTSQGEACRPCLRERVEAQLNHAHTEARKAQRLAELAELLHKHPDVARILDLVEEVRG